MQLVGSLRSPYVRRIRLLLDDLEQDYIFTEVNIFTKEGQIELAKYTSTQRVPILIDNKETVWDSLLITKYLFNKFDKNFKADEKKLILINEGNDSAVTLFQLKNFNLDNDWSNPLSKSHFSRIKKVCTYFNAEELSWNLEGQWLFCFLDWIQFREIYDWKDQFSNLHDFYKRCLVEESVLKTKPE